MKVFINWILRKYYTARFNTAVINICRESDNLKERDREFRAYRDFTSELRYKNCLTRLHELEYDRDYYQEKLDELDAQ